MDAILFGFAVAAVVYIIMTLTIGKLIPPIHWGLVFVLMILSGMVSISDVLNPEGIIAFRNFFWGSTFLFMMVLYIKMKGHFRIDNTVKSHR